MTAPYCFTMLSVDCKKCNVTLVRSYYQSPRPEGLNLGLSTYCIKRKWHVKNENIYFFTVLVKTEKRRKSQSASSFPMAALQLTERIQQKPGNMCVDLPVSPSYCTWGHGFFLGGGDI
jgi:hypothetical protein